MAGGSPEGTPARGGFAEDEREWLEADGLGGFASGTVCGVRTRRYHGLLLAATTPPTGRMMLLNGFDAWVETAAGRVALSSQRYAAGGGSGGSGGSPDSEDVIDPDGASRIESFTREPWPTWTFRLDAGLRLQQEVLVPHGRAAVIVTWRLLREASAGGGERMRLVVRPFLSGRDHHATHHENASLRADAWQGAGLVVWEPYDGVPPIFSRANGRYEHEPDWYRRFLYTAERARGLDDVEDLWTPGWLRWDLGPRAGAEAGTQAGTAAGTAAGAEAGEAVWYLQAGDAPIAQVARLGPLRRTDRSAVDVAPIVAALREEERARRASLRLSDAASPSRGDQAAATRLHRAADAYLVRRGAGRTIVAGYPWFTDWGRDTFIALRGLCLSTGRLAEARDILLEWCEHISEGMLPNRFPDRMPDRAAARAPDRSTAAAREATAAPEASEAREAPAASAASEAPEYNAVDASLWFIAAVQSLCDLADAGAAPSKAGVETAPPAAVLSAGARKTMIGAVRRILEGYARGTRYGIRMAADGLLACGVPGVALTWMDARIGDRVVTPRIGKPVEVQALWLNALRFGAAYDLRWASIHARARSSFEERFWNPHANCLYDIVDVDHEPGRVDASFRPNQIFAVGGLPHAILGDERARLVVDAVEQRLLTPLGLRSLAPGEPGYAPHYGGGPAQRDAAYHQGTVWPWLMGAFVDAWLRVRDRSDTAIEEARRRFLAPLLAHLEEAGLGHVSEIADAEPPFTPGGCPFQAWSLGELLRIVAALDASPPAVEIA